MGSEMCIRDSVQPASIAERTKTAEASMTVLIIHPQAKQYNTASSTSYQDTTGRPSPADVATTLGKPWELRA